MRRLLLLGLLLTGCTAANPDRNATDSTPVIDPQDPPLPPPCDPAPAADMALPADAAPPPPAPSDDMASAPADMTPPPADLTPTLPPPSTELVEHEPNDDWLHAESFDPSLVPGDVPGLVTGDDVDCYYIPTGARFAVNGYYFTKDNTRVCVIGDGTGVVEATAEMMRPDSMVKTHLDGIDAYLFTVDAGDDPLHLGAGSERSELRYWPAIGSGTDRHYTMGLRIPTGTAFATQGVNMFMQFHAPPSLPVDPNLQMNVSPDLKHLRIQTAGGVASGTHVNWASDVATLQLDHWYTIDLHVRWSGGEDSLVEVTIDGKLVATHAGGGNLYWTDENKTATYTTYPKQGWYRGHALAGGTLDPDGTRSQVYETMLFTATAPARYKLMLRP